MITSISSGPPRVWDHGDVLGGNRGLTKNALAVDFDRRIAIVIASAQASLFVQQRPRLATRGPVRSLIIVLESSTALKPALTDLGLVGV